MQFDCERYILDFKEDFCFFGQSETPCPGVPEPLLEFKTSTG